MSETESRLGLDNVAADDYPIDRKLIVGMSVHKAIQKILNQKLSSRVNKGGVASNRTMELRAQEIHRSFRTLSDLGYKLGTPFNLGEKHIKALTNHWDQEGRKNSTISNILSHLRIFCNWMGKEGLVKSLGDYYPHRKDRVKVPWEANEARHLSAFGIDPNQLLAEAELLDERFSVMLGLELYFGLRRKEAIMFNPKYSFQHLPGEHDKSLRISKHAGAKGGRPRVFAFVDESDPAIVDKERARLWRNKQDESALRAKSLCGNTGKLGWFCEEKNGLKRAIQKYQNLCRALGLSKSNRGITGHDLRAHFANEMLLLRGVTPPLLGGDNTEPKEVVRQGVKSAIEALGHSRPGIATFYYGRLQVRQTPKSNEVAEPAKTESKCSVNLSD